MNLIAKLSDGSYNYLPNINIINYINDDDYFLYTYYMNENNSSAIDTINNECNKNKYFYE